MEIIRNLWRGFVMFFAPLYYEEKEERKRYEGPSYPEKCRPFDVKKTPGILPHCEENHLRTIRVFSSEADLFDHFSRYRDELVYNNFKMEGFSVVTVQGVILTYEVNFHLKEANTSPITLSINDPCLTKVVCINCNTVIGWGRVNECFQAVKLKDPIKELDRLFEEALRQAEFDRQALELVKDEKRRNT